MRKTYSLLAFLLLTLTRVAVAQDIIIADPQPVSQPAVQLPLPAADNLWLNEVRGRLDNMMYDRLLQNTQLGLLVYDLTAHQVVYQKNERQRMRPASVMKLVTSITALDMLGGDYQYHTGICYRGHLEGDTLVGDLYFVGGFDPTITRDDLKMMADTISRYGIHRIDGMLVSDLTMKDTLSYGSGWCWDDDNDRLTPLLVDKKDQFMSIMMQEMRARGIQLSVTLARGRLPQGCTEIYRYNSSIDKVLLRMMKQSDNLYAESMFYQIAASTGNRPATARDARSVIRQLVSKVGLNPANYQFADGSGLSLYNYVSPELEVRFLRYAFSNAIIYNHLYQALPIAGRDGTLRSRMQGSFTRGNVHAKTGTVTGISSLCGYLTAANGHHICFSIINQGLLHGINGRRFQDKVCNILCRN